MNALLERSIRKTLSYSQRTSTGGSIASRQQQQQESSDTSYYDHPPGLPLEICTEDPVDVAPLGQRSSFASKRPLQRALLTLQRITLRPTNMTATNTTKRPSSSLSRHDEMK